MAEPKFKVAICGGGIAGLTLAIALNRYTPPHSHIQVDIYEADPEVRTVGAGITVWPRTWGVMQHLGLREDLLQVTVQASRTPVSDIHTDEYRPAFVARKANQPGEGHTYARVDAPAGSTTMHRRDMIDVFLRHIPPSYTFHTSKRLVRYTEAVTDSTPGDPVILHFSDGTSAEADVLVGADGIHSTIRMHMYEGAHSQECTSSTPEDVLSYQQCARCSAAIPKWTGVCSYRYLIPTEKLYSRNPEHTTASIGAILCYSGKDNHIVIYQISGGKFLNFVAICRTPGGEGTPYPGKWVAEVSRDEILSKFLEWEPEVQQMLEYVDKPSRWAIHALDCLPFAVSSSGQVALLGDAMHAMSPNFGAGGGQAIEDAYILGRLLADPYVSLAHIPAALHIYERVRLPFANDILRRGREVGLMYEFNALGYYDGSATTEEKERAQLNALGEAIRKMWQWQWTESVDSLWMQAEGELETLVQQGGVM
ncbi:FAD/NAD(P)-binding domain-containing protein [Lentinus tigrinus ALCF2SS1-7]|uniref:FAD/NAD(P)-binding domain-containing protein n=1 Tax=Lentinus tigrinus ALCF2SS1-6 TaxID=1328759 RepID=A0A5C2SB68_9APHY|nr:FAD/NAD(P)-binding domain-containing protein [Lentinus tigrinus ALCF2SS1-6]RPD75145.1 FAD/NAD(P)-binding domain-containing protein [Lentinus tigrinus ALCF2SS1-7]